MGSMLLPLLVFLVAGLVILGLVFAERYPVETWRDHLLQMFQIWTEKNEPVRMVPQEARLEDLMTRDGESVYVGTESFSGLVDVVERAMDTAENRVGVMRRDFVRKAGVVGEVE